MKTATPAGKEGASRAGGLHHANQVAAFDYSERQAAFAARVLKCLTRTFEAIGASAATREVIFWNLSMTRNLGQNDIVDKPSEFIDGLKDIYGEAGIVVFEYKMTKEIKQEFGLTAEFGKETIKARDLADLLRSLAYAELGPKSTP